MNRAVNPKLGYSALDLAPITKVSSSPLVVVVNPTLGINCVAELVAAAKKAPRKLNYATSGQGSAPHLSAVLFNRIAQVDMVHVPVKVGSPAVQSVVAGDTQVTFGTPPSVLPLVEGRCLRALAITSRDRSPLLPQIPGMREAGLPDYEISFWYDFFMPSGAPAAAIRRVHEAAQGVLQLPEARQALAREGAETTGSKSPEEFAAFVAEDAKFWVRLVEDSRLTPE